MDHRENGGTAGKPFDEAAARRELEQLQREIETQRARRKQAGEAFGAFIESFSRPAEPRASAETPAARAEAPPVSPAAPPVEDVVTTTRPEPPAAPDPPPAALPFASQTPRPVETVEPEVHPEVRDHVRAEAPPDPDEDMPPLLLPELDTPPLPVQPADPDLAATRAPVTPTPAAVPPRSGRTGLLAPAAVLLLIVSAVVWLLLPRSNEPAPSGPAASPAQPAGAVARPPQAQPSPAPPETRQPAAPATQGAASQTTELVTTRAVWLRVVADGVQVMAREVPANSRVPLKAEKTIVIRTGDAGAVRLTVRGKDQGALGGEGQVVTRTFTLEPER